MKILINTPSLKLLGGVANHYLGLRNYWSENVRYNTVGKRTLKQGSGKYWFPWDCVKFIFQLLVFRPDVVLLNPSLGYSALRRDFLFLSIAHRMGFKVAMFIHGFDLEYAKVIDKSWAVSNFNKASLIFVLAESFRNMMLSWGVKSPIHLTTTKVDDDLIEGYDPVKSYQTCNKNILFLSRIEKAKGVYEAVDAFILLKTRYEDLTLTFVGSGSELQALKEYVNSKGLSGVRFTGRLDGEALKNQYKNALLLFLTSHGEGMPTVVLEAMAFGLPVFTRKVGGLVDFFENGKMGYISDSFDPKDFAEAMIAYLDNDNLCMEVSKYNANYAKEHFMASSVAKNIEYELRTFVVK